MPWNPQLRSGRNTKCKVDERMEVAMESFVWATSFRGSQSTPPATNKGIQEYLKYGISASR